MAMKRRIWSPVRGFLGHILCLDLSEHFTVTAHFMTPCRIPGFPATVNVRPIGVKSIHGEVDIRK